METKLLFCLALVLGGIWFECDTSNADESAANSTWKVYQNAHYGFQLSTPPDWTVTETNFEVFHYNEVFLTINSHRPDLALQEQPTGSNTIEYSDNIVLHQMEPGEAYISIGFFDGPGGTWMMQNYVADILAPLWNVKDFTTSSDLSEMNLNFFKRGHRWNITAYLRQPITATASNEVRAVLNSFQFVDAPVGNAAWAESLAWEQLPDNIRKFGYWPVSDNIGGQPYWGRNTVLVEKSGSGYTVHFTLTGLGTWGYTVSDEGKVEAGAVDVHALSPSPSDMPSDLPGESKGRINVYWTDPYVEATEALGKTTTTHFDNGDSAKEPTEAKTNQASYAEYDVKQGWMGLRIYHGNRLVNTVGPFVACYPDYGPAVNDDGSAALLAWNDETKTSAHVFVFNTNGDIRFQTDCGRDAWSPIPAPGGAGVLVRPNGGTNANTYTWYTEKGKMCSMTINWNPEFVGWISGTYQSLFVTSVGFERSFQLIDWSSGTQRWDIPCPGGEFLAIHVSSTLILLSVAEPPTGVWHEVNKSLLQSGNEWVRTFYAVNTDDGKIVARWRGQFPHRWYDSERDHFSQMGDKLFYVTADEFTEINMEDILAKRNGWH